MSRKPLILAAICCVIARPTFAGDAVAIGYNFQGVWAAVTYNRSSTPKGGPHYHDAIQACAFARRDLYVRSIIYLAKTEILGQSDRTGYVAVARGKAVIRNKDVTTIGRGKSQREADRNAIEKLIDRDATTDAAIVYRYFSYGADSGSYPAAKHKTTGASRSVATSASSGRKT